MVQIRYGARHIGGHPKQMLIGEIDIIWDICLSCSSVSKVSNCAITMYLGIHKVSRNWKMGTAYPWHGISAPQAYPRVPLGPVERLRNVWKKDVMR